jgi:hypothetical protein
MKRFEWEQATPRLRRVQSFLERSRTSLANTQFRREVSSLQLRKRFARTVKPIAGRIFHATFVCEASESAGAPQVPAWVQRPSSPYQIMVGTGEVSTEMIRRNIQARGRRWRSHATSLSPST